MLLCLEDHKMIDTLPDIYTVEWLKSQKEEFEAKVSSIVDTQRISSSILHFQSGITKYDMTKNEKAELCPVLLNNGNFFDGKYYSIKVDVPGIEHTPLYYQMACQTIQSQIEDKRSSFQEADCISVFGLAPQPLLLYLGFLLNDETNIKVYQRSREGSLKWDWKASKLTNTFTVEELYLNKQEEQVNSTEVNVIVSISAEISPERVFCIQGNAGHIPTVIIRAQRQAHDAICSEEDVDEFIKIFRSQVVEKIRRDFPKNNHINLFLAAPVALPIRMGMNYQKNVDVEWRIFNQQQNAGFLYTLSIKGDGFFG